MYAINSKNLKCAYKKLKHYFYYYKTSSYLKDKIVDFEKNYTENTFEELAKKLNDLSRIDSKMISGLGVTYTIFPKRDSAVRDGENINISEFNMFIDMPIEFYMVDILFSMDIYKKHNSDDLIYSYGNCFDKRLNFVDEPLNNLLLYGNHSINYKKWKNTVLQDKYKDDSLIIKLDIKRCFYNIKFNIPDFIKNILNINYLDDPVTKIMVNIYRYYSKIINDEMKISQIENENEVTLPIGLFSSYAILNILLSPIDKYLASNSNSYARYVDDILIVKNATLERRENKKNLITKLWPDLFKIMNNELIVDTKKIKCGNITINSSKIEIIQINKRTNLEKFNKKIKKAFFASLEFDEELETDDSSIEVEYSYSSKYLSKKIYSFINDCTEESKQELLLFLEQLRDEEWINLYSLWPELLAFLYKNFSVDSFNTIKNIIMKNIEKINITGFNPIILSKAKNQLYTEVKSSVLLHEENYQKYLLYPLNQNDIISYINDIYENEIKYNFFPVNISLDEITYYLVVVQNINSNIITESKDLFQKINNYYKNGELLIERDEGCIKKIYSANDNDNEGAREKVMVAVASMNILEDEIEEYNFKCKFPSTYGLHEIKNLIKTAKLKGANILVFPEFCLPNNYAFDIIKYSKKIGISIVCGLTHIIDTNKEVSNYVLVRDNYLDISILKQKNYFAEKEKYLCIKNGFMYKESIYPFYYVIDNGKFKYSVMTCFEATNINDRSILCDEIELLFMSVFNKDVNYFSNIIASYSRDASCFIVQSNPNCYGDSRITGPFSQINADIVKLKGGNNNYFVIGEVDFNSLVDKHKKWVEVEQEMRCYHYFGCNIKDLEKIYEDYRKMKAKPLSAGNHLQTRKRNKID